MRVINYNNKNCLTLKDADGQITPFQVLIVSTSGSGKGTTGEGWIESWKRATGGVVIVLNDPKNEAEFSYVMYEPEAKYHLTELKVDGIKKGTHKAKLYHPYTHNLAKKGMLPDINFYSISIKDMTKEDWSILAESDAESETIKLLERVAEDLPRNDSLFDFLQEIERLTEGKKDKNKAVADPKNWFLKSGGGTSKSVKQVGNMLSSFKKNYLLRKDTCELKLDWEKILLDSENYHVFLSNWVDNSKLKNFLVECLLGQAVNTAQRLSNTGKLKKPILFVIPELLNMCPSESKGSSQFLAKAVRKHIVTMRSQAGGMSILGDTQNWSQTSPELRGSFNQTFYGKLNPEDARIIFKANSYTATQRGLFDEVEEKPGSFIWYKHEDYGVFSMFMPSHMHKEVKYNWIQMYKKHFKNKMKSYNYLVKIMKTEYDEEYEKTKDSVFRKIEEKEEAERQKEEAKEQKDKPKQVRKKTLIFDPTKTYILKRAYELHKENLSDRKIADELGIKSHKTAKKYYTTYEQKLKEKKKEEGSPESINSNLGEGIMPEEVESNFAEEFESEE